MPHYITYYVVVDGNVSPHSVQLHIRYSHLQHPVVVFCNYSAMGYNQC